MLAAFAILCVCLYLFLPSFLQKQIETALTDAGFHDPKIGDVRIGISSVQLADIQLSNDWLTLSNQSITSRSDFNAISDARLSDFIIEGLDATVQVAPLIQAIRSKETQDNAPPPDAPSINYYSLWNLPFEKLLLSNSQLTLQFPDFKQTFQLSAFKDNQPERPFLFLADSPTEHLALDARLDRESKTTAISLQTKTKALRTWLDNLQPYLLFQHPALDNLTTQTTHFDLSVETLDTTPTRWLALTENQTIETHFDNQHITLQSLTSGANGTPDALQKHWLIAAGGLYQKEDIQFAWQRLAWELDNPYTLSGRLLDWKLTQHPDNDQKLTTLESGPLHFTVKGPLLGKDTAPPDTPYTAQIHMPPSSLDLITPQGEMTADGELHVETNILDKTIKTRAHLVLNQPEVFLTQFNLSAESITARCQVEQSTPHHIEATVKSAQASWQKQKGSLTDLNGTFRLASLKPLTTDSPQTLHFGSLTQGDISLTDGTLTLEFKTENTRTTAHAELTATFFEGTLHATAVYPFDKKGRADLDLHLDRVNLSRLAKLIPQFKGQLEGLASGNLTAHYQNKNIQFEPSRIGLTPGTQGRLRYLQKNWLTQDPDLDIDAIIQELNADQLMLFMSQDVKALQAFKDKIQLDKVIAYAPQIVTELALRDILMDDFEIHINNPDFPDNPVIARIEGRSDVKGINIPVKINIPIQIDGPLQSVFNFIMQLQ